MSIELITILLFGSLAVMLVLGLPFAFAAGGVSVAFLIHMWGTPAFLLVTTRVWGLMGNFVLVAVPLFILMANVLKHSGIVEELYETVYQWLGRLRGGLAITTVMACAILAALVGIIGAGVVIMGLVALPVMLKHHYHKGTALGSICAGGGLGVLIPPSVLFIMFGFLGGVSIGHLFLGGVIPGMLLTGLYILYITVRCYFQPSLCPALPKEAILPLRQKVILLKGLILPVLLMVAVLGSIFAGIATPTEAAGIGSFGAFLCAAVRGRLNWKMVKEAVYETTTITCMIMWIIFGGYTLIGIYTLAGGAVFIEELILGLPLCRWGILIVMQLIFILFGLFMDYIGILMITVPIFLPIIEGLGFDPVWFGILLCLNMQISFLSPPFGLSLFYLKGVAPPGITMADLYRCVWPFIAIQLITLVLVMIFPQIGLWLPYLVLP